MSLLPRTAGEFSSAEYWERFFKKRGEKAFEWYGDYNKLCGVLHKYIKVKDKVLVVGCGNSELSEQMYDVGYKHLINIDISETVINNMNQRNFERRPDLRFQQIDATKTPFEDGSFQVVLDKGTLDAMASEEEGALASSMITEMSRVLSFGGRYVCITLAQESVIKLAVAHFVSLGWAARLHCLQNDTESEEDSFALPVFVLICTKFRQPMPMPILEMCLGEDGASTRFTQVSELLSTVREHQAYSVLRKRLRTGTDVSSNVSLTLCHVKTGLPKYTLTVQDSAPGTKVPKSNHFAIFIVPQGSETAWLYSSAEGHKQLAASANFRRLVIVAMHRNQDYANMEAVQAELSPMVMDLAPPAMPHNHQVPFLSATGDLGWREVVSTGVSELSGEYCVENVRGEDGELYRRLVFLSNAALIQSESKLVSKNTTGYKKKGKKKVKPTTPSTVPSSSLSVDTGFLCCEHHKLMVAGLSMLGIDTQQKNINAASIFLVGLGGGGLPQFLRDFVPGVTVEVVELDPVVLEVAKEWFGFRPDERLTVTLGDGLELITAYGKEGRLFDAIMFDVDNKDNTVGMSCPPASFVEVSILQKVNSLLTPTGVFILNLVCRDSLLKKSLLERLRSVFPTIISGDVEGEVNQVLMCHKGDNRSPDTANTLQSLGQAAKSLQSTLGSDKTGNHSPNIDISELIKELKIA
ncbi:eEF1A lysine and N-terminal methyltransferase isoform X1 [Periophthalmus magnuspinnatus]|uniref:eEF1A lysine and N-terminal methyltransferase isoform X1 n=1 Tax=Periophthalmus magnuspinnatus TaxID=409849 RepID=UPI00145B080F|nr:eEF1A lysine and N-terminal methyltransferase isoform X1 [Periophthalmus magnuspinnatus]